jgi:hypothetical protein
MKIFKDVNFKNKEEKKALFYSALIFIGVSQLFALLIWYVFDKDYFIPLLIGSIVGFLFSYRGVKKT